ncbi:MAG: hypothetical protein ACRD3J_27245, partial [Thermoanaerobaculia bacterium]
MTAQTCARGPRDRRSPHEVVKECGPLAIDPTDTVAGPAPASPQAARRTITIRVASFGQRASLPHVQRAPVPGETRSVKTGQFPYALDSLARYHRPQRIH